MPCTLGKALLDLSTWSAHSGGEANQCIFSAFRVITKKIPVELVVGNQGAKYDAGSSRGMCEISKGMWN